MRDTEETKRFAIVTAGITASIIAISVVGMLSNNHADEQRTQMETACVKTGGSWISDEMACRR